MTQTDPNIPGLQPLLPRRAENARSLLFVLCTMAFLAGLALLFSRGTTRLSSDWQDQLTHSATVQIIHSTAQTKDAQLQSAMDILGRLLPAKDITPLTDAEAQARLKPWLGDVALPDDMAIPSLITLSSDQSLPLETIEIALADGGLITHIDDHQRFAGGIRHTARRLVFLGMALLVILLGASLSMSIYATRASLSSQRDILRVLVQVGASNQFVAKLFITQAGRRTVRAALIGLGIAFLFWTILSLLGISGDVGWGGLKTAISDFFWLGLLGVVFVLICAAAAGLTATQYLSRERRFEE